MHVETAKFASGGNKQLLCRRARDGTAHAMGFLATDDSSALVAAAQETSRTPLPSPRHQAAPPSRLWPRGLARVAGRRKGSPAPCACRPPPRSPAAARARPHRALAAAIRPGRAGRAAIRPGCAARARRRRRRCACVLALLAALAGRRVLARRRDTPRPRWPRRTRRDTAQVCCACSPRPCRCPCVLALLARRREAEKEMREEGIRE